MHSKKAILGFIGIGLIAVIMGCDQGEHEEAFQTTNGTSVTQDNTSAMVPETHNPVSCKPGSTIKEQKARLVALAKQQFAGATSHDPNQTRLHYDPDARERRQGGILVFVEFNADELDTVKRKKAALDVLMRDAYETFYSAGCGDLAQVDLSARANALAIGGIEGANAVQTLAVVFKTRIKIEKAEIIDWENKASLDFNEIWETLLLNRRWRNELEDK